MRSCDGKIVEMGVSQFRQVKLVNHQSMTQDGLNITG